MWSFTETRCQSHSESSSGCAGCFILGFLAADLNISIADVRIKEEPDSGDWQLSTDSTLNTSDLSHLRVRLVEEDDQLGQEGKRLRRVACTCPNCKESGGR